MRSLLVWVLTLAGTALAALWFSPPADLIRGMIWQPTADYLAPTGCPGQLGATDLVVQWIKVNDHALAAAAPSAEPIWKPDWSEIGSLPWVHGYIVGLAGAFDLDQARRDARELARISRELAAHSPLPATAWYAPIEISPDWQETQAIRAYLAELPRPLWASIYGGYELSDEHFVDWVDQWLSDGVGLFYQDGVGVNRQSPERAALRAGLLIKRFGPRVAIVLEAFRQHGDRFETSDVWGLIRQLRAYRGLPVYVFSLRHLSCGTTLQLKLAETLGALD